MSFQIFAISERSKFWKQIAGKSLKANRWKIFESFLKANRWKIFESFLKANRRKIFESYSLENFWKLFESKSLENFWKLFESKSLENFWKQIAGKFLKAFWKLGHIVFAMAAVRLGQIPLHLREKIVRLINEGKSQREVHRRRSENNCYFADPLPVYLLITVKTNARVNTRTRDSKMLPTNHAMRSDCRRRSHTHFGERRKPSHYWHGTLKFTNCESIFKPSDSYSVARLPEYCFTEYTKTRVIYKI